MEPKIIIYIAISLIYYNIAGLATTNIIRLTKNNTLSVNAKECRCDNCNAKINPFLQLPIISFILCKGKCLNCGSKIPLYPLILEIFVFVGMTLLSAICNFSLTGVLLSFLLYEVTRIVVIMLKGKREKNFWKEYFVAVASMFIFLALTIFASLLGTVV